MAQTLKQMARKISIMGYEGSDLVDITGPYEVFATASALAEEAGRPRPYVIELLSCSDGFLMTDAGLKLCADRTLDQFDGADTILVAGGVGKFAAMSDDAVSSFLRTWFPKVRRIGSICTGAFLLAAAGILDQRRAVTHWRWCDRLVELYPSIRLDRDAIFVRDGDVYTTAGVTAGIDLALAMVEADCGRDLAMAVAREMVVFAKRPGGQAQFSAQLSSQIADRSPIRAVQEWVANHADAQITVEALADRAGMSPRNFARVFKAQTGETPRRYVEKVRLERARMLLEETALPLDRIASSTGFASAEVLRRTFQRQFGVSPGAYADRFGGV